MTAHALLSPSSAHRWLVCTPSARLEAKEKDHTTVYAEEGTLAHRIGEIKLRAFNHEISPEEEARQLDECKMSSLFYPGMIDEVEDYVGFCEEAYNSVKGATLCIEKAFDLSAWAPGSFGTGDCVILSPGALHIVDLKFGKGQAVSAYENPQLKLYALGAISEWDFVYEIEEVTLTIAQVRLGGIDSYTLSKEELLRWGEEVVKPKAQAAYKGEGERTPDRAACRFCRIRNTCKARADAILSGLPLDRDPGTLTPEEIGPLLVKAQEAEAWAKDLAAYALDEALKGQHFPGWKVVAGRSARKITDEEALAKALTSAGYTEADIYKPRQLEGVTQLTRVLGKAKFNELATPYIEKPQGKPTLVEETDKRPALDSAASEFTFN